MARITLKELKAQVESTQGQKLPTPKTLREKAQMVVQANLSGCEMTVFSNGFAVYQNDTHYTVLRMEHVGKANYYSEVEDKAVAITVEDEDWSVGVMLCGEERLEKRCRDMAENRLVSMYTNTEDGEEEIQFDSGEDFAENIATKDEVHSILDCLTERQRQVVEMYYLEQLTQQQIADRLGIKKQSVNENLKLAFNRLQKKL